MSTKANFTLVINAPEGIKQFVLPVQGGMTLLDALLYAQEEIDSSISVNWNCRTAQCGICAILANDAPSLACMEKVIPEQTYEVKPICPERHIKGLVCDVSSLYEEFFLTPPVKKKESSRKRAFERILLKAASERTNSTSAEGEKNEKAG